MSAFAEASADQTHNPIRRSFSEDERATQFSLGTTAQRERT
jgi:hypothetical protein